MPLWPLVPALRWVWLHWRNAILPFQSKAMKNVFIEKNCSSYSELRAEFPLFHIHFRPFCHSAWLCYRQANEQNAILSIPIPELICSNLVPIEHTITSHPGYSQAQRKVPSHEAKGRLIKVFEVRGKDISFYPIIIGYQVKILDFSSWLPHCFNQ